MGPGESAGKSVPPGVQGALFLARPGAGIAVGQTQNHESARDAAADIRAAQPGTETGRRAQRQFRRDAQTVGEMREHLLRADNEPFEISL